jgi:phosphopantetheine adenylyltransferase
MAEDEKRYEEEMAAYIKSKKNEESEEEDGQNVKLEDKDGASKSDDDILAVVKTEETDKLGEFLEENTKEVEDGEIDEGSEGGMSL